MSKPITLFGKEVHRRPDDYSWDEYEASYSCYSGVIHDWKKDVMSDHPGCPIHWHLIWEPSRNYDLRADGWVKTIPEAIECIETAMVTDFLDQFDKRWRHTLKHVQHMQNFMWGYDAVQRRTAWDRILGLLEPLEPAEGAGQEDAKPNACQEPPVPVPEGCSEAKTKHPSAN